MDLLHNLTLGFGVALTFQNLFYALVGCMVGTLIGVLPGIGPVATIAMLLPITFHLPPTAALIMLAGIYYGVQRFTFGIPELSDGIAFAPIAMGLFGIAEIVVNLERGMSGSGAIKVTSLWPTREEARRAWPAVVRGTVLGSLLGVLPGGGPTLGAFSAYTLEKQLSKTPEIFGKGAVEGVAAPEAANNAAAQTSFIPMLTLGIPSNAVMALMVGAMIIQGIQPGPE